MKPVVAYVDDDFANLNFYKDLLSDYFTVETFARSLDLTEALEKKAFDCFILDIYMPVLDGFQLMEKIRARPESSRTPVFFVTANPHDEIKIRSFNQGAADFFDRMVKRDELVARLQSRIRTHKDSLNLIKVGKLTLDLQKLDCFIGSTKVDLTMIEFKVVTRLIQQSPQKVTKADLVRAIWGDDSLNTNNLNTHVYNLRTKLADWDYEIENHRVQGFSLKEKGTV